MRKGESGYTLVELILAMLVFSVVMLLISVSFSRIVRSSGQLVKAVETDIGGLIGLELLRCDLELAGFGLPWSIPDAIDFKEVADTNLLLVDGCKGGCAEAKASIFNDRPDLLAPTAYRIGNNVGYNNSDYLVLKGVPLGTSTVCRGWSYLNYSSAGTVVKSPFSDPGLKPGADVRAIVLKTGIVAGVVRRELASNGSTFSLPFNQPLPEVFCPRDRGDTYLAYAVAKNDADGLPLHFPFNRADYYISRKEGKVSPSCNGGTGVLYKTTVNHSWPITYTEYPLLDCVADIQAVLYMDTDGDGRIDYHPDPDDHLFTAQELREQLKEIRVYVLAQQGRKDPGYQYPMADPARAIVVGDPGLADSLGQVWSESALKASFGSDWSNYRWRLYTIVVQPKNL